MSVKSLLNDWIKNQFHVAFCASCLYGFLSLNHGFKSDYLLVIFCGTWLFYNYFNQTNPFKWQSWKKRWAIYSCLLLGFIFWQWPTDKLLLFLISNLPAWFYALPNSKKGFRFIPGFKIFFIATYWTYLVYAFPLILNNSFIINWLNLIPVFIFIVAITLPFDVKDRMIDEKKLQTLPQVLGISIALFSGMILLLLSAILGLFLFKDVEIKWAWTISCLLSLFLIHRKNPTFFYVLFWVELCSALPIISWAILSNF